MWTAVPRMLRPRCPGPASLARPALTLAAGLLLVLLGSCGGKTDPAETPTAASGAGSPAVQRTETPEPTPSPKPTATPTPTPTPEPTATPEPDGPGVVTGTIIFNGDPVSLVSGGLAHFNVWDPDTLERPGFLADYDPASGDFELRGLPAGHFSVFAWVDALDPEGKLSAGDYYSGISGMSPEVTLTPGSPAVSADIPVVQIIHVTFPVDSSSQRTAVGDAPETLLLSAAQTFIWDPVPGAATYMVSVREVDSESGDGIGGDNNRWMKVSEPRATFDPPLVPSEEGRHYGFLAEAYDAQDHLIGVFRHFYTNGDGGWFYFRAVESP